MLNCNTSLLFLPFNVILLPLTSATGSMLHLRTLFGHFQHHCHRQRFHVLFLIGHIAETFIVINIVKVTEDRYVILQLTFYEQYLFYIYLSLFMYVEFFL